MVKISFRLFYDQTKKILLPSSLGKRGGGVKALKALPLRKELFCAASLRGFSKNFHRHAVLRHMLYQIKLFLYFETFITLYNIFYRVDNSSVFSK